MNFKQLILAGAVIASTTLTPLTNVQAENTLGFKDVPENHWSYQAIMDLKRKILWLVMETECLVLVIILHEDK